jgi:hypothetical protein
MLSVLASQWDTPHRAGFWPFASSLFALSHAPRQSWHQPWLLRHAIGSLLCLAAQVWSVHASCISRKPIVCKVHRHSQTSDRNPLATPGSVSDRYNASTLTTLSLNGTVTWSLAVLPLSMFGFPRLVAGWFRGHLILWLILPESCLKKFPVPLFQAMVPIYRI